MKRNFASFSVALVAAAYAGIALASILGVRSFHQTLEEMSRIGGGIRGISEGILAAATLPTAAAWIAAVASLAVLVFAVPAAKRQAAEGGSARALPWLAALALTAGAAAAMLFRAAMEFVTSAVLPGAPLGGQSPGDAIASRLLSTGVIAAVCFVVAVAAGIIALRATPSRGAFRAAVLSLVVSFGVSAALVVTLHSLSERYERILTMGERP